MKKICCLFPAVLLLCGGCHSVGDKALSMTVIYGVMAVLSLMLLVGCICTVGKKNIWFLTLYTSVTVVNTGYFLLSVSKTPEAALWANRLSYLGSVFLPLAMLMIILDTLELHYKKRLPVCLLIFNSLVFFLTATAGWLPIYYKEVSLTFENGVSVLNKVYGPLHGVYLVFLVGYFLVMIASLIHAVYLKRIQTGMQAAVLIVAVFSNIIVWLMEQLVRVEFELLSVSYIITELFLLGLFLLTQEQSRHLESLRAQLSQPAIVVSDVTDAQYAAFLSLLPSLTHAERGIVDLYAAGNSSKEILAALHITENTLKYHNKNIYAKLGITSRKQLIALATYRQ